MKKKLVGLIAITMGAVGCSSDSSTSPSGSDGVSVTKPSSVFGEITNKAQSAGQALGNALTKQSVSSNLFSKLMLASGPSVMNGDSRCNENGAPYAVDSNFEPVTDLGQCVANGGHEENGECLMNSNHVEYAGQRAYCLLAKDTGNSDSILGAFSLLKNVTCSLERSGIVWHDSKPTSPDSVDIIFDSSCFTNKQLGDMCDDGESCTYTATVEAYLNPDEYYGAQISMSIDLGGGNTLAFDAKLKATATVTEIAVSSVGINDPNQFDAYAAKYDSSTNTFTYEGRFDRIDSGGGGGTGGWSRHIRVFADLDSSANIMPEKIEVAYANLYKGGSNYDSELVTLRGSMKTPPLGLTGVVYHKNDVHANLTSVLTMSDATPQVNCYKAGEDAVGGICEDVDPIEIPNGELAFFLPGGSYRVNDKNANSAQYQANPKWFESLLGLSFTTVDLSKTEP